ncbi:unnamed protein product, partial [Ectocarpus sp. 6 AP-2014]
MTNCIWSWLKRNGCNADTSGDTPMTHTIMSGGTLYVPEDLYDEFLGVYAREIERENHTLAYSEKRSPDVFRMYFDLDLLDKHEMDESSILAIVRKVQQTTALFFEGAEDEAMKCVVSRTQTKEVECCETFIKNGVHLNFPKLLVNLDMALQIRFSVVNHLEREFGQREVSHNPWSDVIDKAPYFNGLKMTGSVKRVQCKNCDCSKKKRQTRGEKEEERLKIVREIGNIRRKLYKRHDDAFDYTNVMTFEGDEYKNVDLSNLHTKYHALTSMCFRCNNKGWFLEQRYYSPSHILGAGGVLCCDDLQYLRSNYHEQMRWTSIRARTHDEATPSYSVPAGHIRPPEDTASTCLRAFGSSGLQWVSPGLYREMINSDVHAEDAKGLSRWKGKTITDKASMDAITHCVRGMHDKYKNIIVKQAVEIKTGKKTSDNSHTITSGPAAGMVVKRTSNKQTAAMIARMAASNKTTIEDNVNMRVYTTVVVRVSGEGSKYCQNKGDEHASNSVYFCISKAAMWQMCHSGKDTVGCSGKTCKKYRSNSKQTPARLSKILF